MDSGWKFGLANWDVCIYWCDYAHTLANLKGIVINCFCRCHIQLGGFWVLSLLIFWCFFIFWAAIIGLHRPLFNGGVHSHKREINTDEGQRAYNVLVRAYDVRSENLWCGWMWAFNQVVRDEWCFFLVESFGGSERSELTRICGS